MKPTDTFKKYSFLCVVGTALILLSLKMTLQSTPLVPRAVLFGNSSMISVSISPCGKKLAFIDRLHPNDETSPLTIWLQTLGSLKKKPLIISLTQSIRHYYWSSNGSKILYIQDTNGDENWRVYGVDIQTKEVVCYTPFDNCQAHIIELSDALPSTIALTLNKRDPRLHDLYTLNIDTGALTLVCINSGSISQWALDKQLRVRAALQETADGGKELLKAPLTPHSPWEVIRTYSPDDSPKSCALVAHSSHNDCLYLLESKGYNTTRLIAFNLTTKESSVVIQDPTYDLVHVYLDQATEEIQAVVYDKQKQEWHFLLPGIYERIYRAVSRSYTGNIEVLNSDAKGRYFIVSIERDTCPISYYLYDDSTRSLVEICRSRPDIQEKDLCPTQPIMVESRDGLSLHGYLTLPKGSKGPVPLVLMVHDGPWKRVHWGYNATTQWLTNRGYGVLTINYRGSTGYGKEFMNAGNREWGGAMQQDLVDAVTWAIEHGIADPKKIAIFGGSYGGYAALVGATDTPSLFCCAVDIAGMSNLVSLLRSIPPYWSVYRAQLYKAIGNPYTEEEFLKSRSPLFKVDALQIPLFIAQGAQDPRVAPAESEQIVESLKKKGIPHIYLLFEDEGHIVVNAHNRLVLYAAIEKFLAHTLGGLCEP